jgi:hypothetical protein
MNRFLVLCAFCIGGICTGYAQKADTVKPNKENTAHVYFIITAGDVINAFFNDKPITATTVPEFSDYVQGNIKSLKDSWVVVTGKPNTGTFNDVVKILSRYRFKHVTKNIIKD